MGDGTLFYTRWEDGSLPVRVRQDPAGKRLFSLEDADRGKTRTFDSARQLLITVTGHPRARNWTADRYFRIGKFQPHALTVVPSVTIDDLLALDTGLTVAPAILNHRLGIDLKRRGHEVAKLLFAGFGHQIHREGYDPEDVLQEVYRGLLARNRGICPWDENKSSFGHYVHMVCRCVLSNFARKQRRIRAFEQVGLKGWQDGQLVDVDAATAARDDRSGLDYLQRDTILSDVLVEDDFKNYIMDCPDYLTADGQLALKIVPLVHMGHTRAEIATLMGLSRAAVSRALTYIRAKARGWSDIVQAT